jgi:DNA primase
MVFIGHDHSCPKLSGIHQGNKVEDMATRLDEVIQKASELPRHLQDEMAEQWLEDIENELKWQQTLEQPQEKLVKLAEKALQQSSRGETIKAGFDEI